MNASTTRQILGLLLAYFVISQPYGNSQANDDRLIKVACVGDSITAGARVDTATQSYPAQLQKLLGSSFKVANFGRGGATLIRKGSPNVWQSLDAIRKFNPDLVVVSLGTNDTVSGRRLNWEKIARFDQDYRDLINELRRLPSRPRIIMCTPTSMVLNTPGLSTDRLANLKERQPRLQELCQRTRSLAQEFPKSVSLLELNSILAKRPELLTPKDGVHPNADGYAQIAIAVSKRVRSLTNRRPNIVLFLVDDMGWQDTSVPFHTQVTELNKKFDTPHMEKLAKRGIKFTQAYACSVCSPTRVSLMTGLNAARHRVTNWTLRKNATNDRPHPLLDFPKWNVNGISPVAGIERTVHAESLPAFLKPLGYRTIHVGKAHFGATGTPASDPTAIGFDVNIAGHAAGGPGSFLGTQNFSAAWRNGDRIWDVPGLDAYHGKEIFLTDALTREAIKQVDQSIEAAKPFFLYLSHYAVHVPFAKDRRYYQKYRDRGLVEKEAMYAAMIEGMDDSLGKVMAHVEASGQIDNTIFLFMSDNGGLSASGRGGPAHTHNLPLSSGKGSAHEGGVRVPMIVSWPQVTQPATQSRQPIIIEDFFATILSMAGAENVKQVGGVIDGLDFSNVLLGVEDQKRSRRPLVWHFPNHWGPRGPGIGPSSAIRIQNWKYIKYYDGRPDELFDLARDLGETHNRCQEERQVADRLARELERFLKSANAQFPRLKNGNKPAATSTNKN